MTNLYKKTLQQSIEKLNVNKSKLATLLEATPLDTLETLESKLEQLIIRTKPIDKPYSLTYDISWVAEILDDEFYTLFSSGDKDTKLEALVYLAVKLNREKLSDK